jgi:hypothetical protein
MLVQHLYPSMERTMTRRRLGSIGLALLGLAWVPHTGYAADDPSEPPVPKGTVAVGQQSTEFIVRFDKPVNHTLSSLSIIHDGKVIGVLNSRLDAAPNVLFARIRTPPAGRYVLHWTFCPEGTADKFDGEVPFTIEQ